MSTITTRYNKGAPLTNSEIDANFTNLNTDKLEKAGGAVTGALSVAGAFTVGTSTPFASGTGRGALAYDGGAEWGMGVKNTNAAVNPAYPFVFLNASETIVGHISHSPTATSYNTTSDVRAKENIADAEDAGPRIDAIQIRQFDWKVTGEHQDYGVIAQELEAVYPSAVTAPQIGPDGEEMYRGVDFSKLVPLLIKEVQSLRARVAQLEGGAP